jgi:Photoprotection regulator fluorescence recovery protein
MFRTNQEFEWSKVEKQAARMVFETAYERECRAIRAKVVKMMEDRRDHRKIWRIHDYLSEQRRETDKKYDYRYSVLIWVFARLFREGWLTADDLNGLRQEKIDKIKELARLP